MSKRNEEDLKLLLKALYPIIYIVSYEEKRIINTIDKIRLDPDSGLKYKICIWSQDLGLMDDEGRKNVEQLSDTIAILKHIRDTERKEKTVYILKDYDQHMEDELIQRHLRTIGEGGNIRCHIIILSPILNLPTRLEKSIQIIEWDLPDKEERNNIISFDKKARNEKILSLEEREKVNKAMAGLTETEAVNCIAKQAAIDKSKVVTVELLNREKLQIIKKNPVLEIYIPRSDDNFDSIGGWDRAKGYITKVRKVYSEKARAFGIESPKGVLLFGIPGCGKSKFAKCIGYELVFPVITMDIGRVFSSRVGDSETNMRQALKTIEAVAPCVVFLDEIEKGASGVDSSGQSDAGVTARVIGSFMIWLQDREGDIFVIATANDPTALPAAFTRSGRWDSLMFVSLPTQIERESIFKIHLAKRRKEIKKFEISKLAKAADTFAGAEIENVVKMALIDAFDADSDLTNRFLFNRIQYTTPLAKYRSKDIHGLIEWARVNNAETVSSVEADGEVKVLQLVKKGDKDEKGEGPLKLN